MIETLLIIAVAIATIAVYLLKQDEPQNPLSFYESMKLCNLPIITMKVGGYMVRKMMYGYAETSVMSASTVYFGDVSYTDHT